MIVNAHPRSSSGVACLAISEGAPYRSSLVCILRLIFLAFVFTLLIRKLLPCQLEWPTQLRQYMTSCFCCLGRHVHWYGP